MDVKFCNAYTSAFIQAKLFWSQFYTFFKRFCLLAGTRQTQLNFNRGSTPFRSITLKKFDLSACRILRAWTRTSTTSTPSSWLAGATCLSLVGRRQLCWRLLFRFSIIGQLNLYCKQIPKWDNLFVCLQMFIIRILIIGNTLKHHIYTWI